MLLFILFISANENGVIFGPRAMMLGGAASALIDDGTALQYNPAGIAPTANSLDVSGNAFSLRLHHSDAFLQGANGERGAGSASEIVSIPSATTFARRVNDRFAFAFGLFAPRASDYTLRSRLQFDNANTWVATLSETTTELRASVGGAYHSDQVSLGLGVDLGVTSEFSASSAAGGTPSTGDNLIVASTQSSKVISLAARAGLIWRAWHGLRFGASVSSPSMSILRVASADSVAGSAVGNGRFVQIDPATSEFVADVRQIDPTVVRMGIGWKDDAWSVACDVLVSTLSPGRHAQVDVLAGARGRLTDKVSLGGGVFTDRSVFRRGVSLARSAVDFYGATASVEFVNRYARAASDRTIDFATTIGLRYAFGTGVLDGLVLPSTFDGRGLQTVDSATHTHELSLLLGSSLDL